MSIANRGNSVVSAVEMACGIFGVRCYRQQSRTFTVQGAKGRERPMFMGMWRDALGRVHRKGMADLLLTPAIRIHPGTALISVVLWVECKAGTGELEPEQKLFRDDVIEAGASYIQARDSADLVVEWFKAHGVSR